MDKFEYRRQALLRLVESMGRGGRAQVAKNIGREPNYISRLLYPLDKKGAKKIGDELIEALDSAYPGWLGDNTPITAWPKKQTFAGAIRQEAQTDPYAMLEAALRALVIVGSDKEEVVKLVQEKAAKSAEIQAAMRELGKKATQ